MPVRVTDHASVLLAPNPGPMTLDGTRSYVLAAPGARTRMVVDPGPDDVAHLSALADGPRVELVLVTHRHADHTAGAARFAELTGAPVRAADPVHCHPAGGGPLGGSAHGGTAEPLHGGEVLHAAGLRIEVVATPGHTADSLSFRLPDDGPRGSVLTGDTILGRGTTVISAPDGSLSDYLTSLDTLEAFGAATVLPAHGPHLDDLSAVVRAYREHRLGRLAEVRAALAAAGLAGDPVTDRLVEQVTAIVYGAVTPGVLPAARQSVRAQLRYLAERT
ncbi:MBL fold metallo-hydrolase [Oerskovia enterophila]|uniref:Hydroxyacylglutathione hydrolase n=1 Tax=Oerskovia enterophila TaxID=43678 RepID=A0A163RV56_9CELL|nr:MBL fold metallo-hydrolase [Oerskovia enterophila]KZM35729.1 hydroxyacylglutathione hydrolase [Oerskovia enterophila]